MQEELNWAWLAGFFDGEGNTAINISKDRSGQHRYYIRIRISQCDRRVLEKAQSIAGGNITGPYSCSTSTYPRKNTSPLYSWGITNYDDCMNALERMWPYLGEVKRIQATEVIDKRNNERSLNPVNPSNSGFQPLDLDMDKIKHMYVDEGLSTIKIAAVYDVVPGTISNRLKKIGVEMRGSGK